MPCQNIEEAAAPKMDRAWPCPTVAEITGRDIDRSGDSDEGFAQSVHVTATNGRGWVRRRRIRTARSEEERAEAADCRVGWRFIGNPTGRDLRAAGSERSRQVDHSRNSDHADSTYRRPGMDRRLRRVAATSERQVADRR